MKIQVDRKTKYVRSQLIGSSKGASKKERNGGNSEGRKQNTPRGKQKKKM